MKKLNRLYVLVRAFVVGVVTGYEPVAARAMIAAVFVAAAAFGIGSGATPPQVDAVIGLIAVVSPLVAGWLARAKVSPVHTIRSGVGRR